MTRAASRPGDGLLDPVVLIGLAVLFLNDQIGKATWPEALRMARTLHGRSSLT